MRELCLPPLPVCRRGWLSVSERLPDASWGLRRGPFFFPCARVRRHSPEESHAVQERLIQLLALLPVRDRGAAAPLSPDHMDGHLCAALCLHAADEPVAALDTCWGQDWAEALVEQELLDEFMVWLEERWQALQEALDPQQLQQDPDALPLAEALPWVIDRPGARTPSRQMPAAARAWAEGFLLQCQAEARSAADPELLGVIAALTMEEGPALLSYIQDAYDRPHDIGAAELIDDALFAAQDLRRALH